MNYLVHTDRKKREGKKKWKVFLKLECHLINMDGMMEMGTTWWQNSKVTPWVLLPGRHASTPPPLFI